MPRLAQNNDPPAGTAFPVVRRECKMKKPRVVFYSLLIVALLAMLVLTGCRPTAMEGMWQENLEENGEPPTAILFGPDDTCQLFDRAEEFGAVDTDGDGILHGVYEQEEDKVTVEIEGMPVMYGTVQGNMVTLQGGDVELELELVYYMIY